MARPTTRLVAVITLLLGLVMLSAAVAPPAMARAPRNDRFGHAAKIGSFPYHKSEAPSALGRKRRIRYPPAKLLDARSGSS